MSVHVEPDGMSMPLSSKACKRNRQTVRMLAELLERGDSQTRGRAIRA